jgi:hypothetical protein
MFYFPINGEFQHQQKRGVYEGGSVMDNENNSQCTDSELRETNTFIVSLVFNDATININVGRN